ncbi:hypothetical protein, partial [Thioclava sp. SK-1]|uniref:hypothetical protein n=1 Tax=Thioclava sp. SK-1 TaxID=1889770 RepID=UPI00159F34E1
EDDTQPKGDELIHIATEGSSTSVYYESHDGPAVTIDVTTRADGTIHFAATSMAQQTLFAHQVAHIVDARTAELNALRASLRMDDGSHL